MAASAAALRLFRQTAGEHRPCSEQNGETEVLSSGSRHQPLGSENRARLLGCQIGWAQTRRLGRGAGFTRPSSDQSASPYARAGRPLAPPGLERQKGQALLKHISIPSQHGKAISYFNYGDK